MVQGRWNRLKRVGQQCKRPYGLERGSRSNNLAPKMARHLKPATVFLNENSPSKPLSEGQGVHCSVIVHMSVVHLKLKARRSESEPGGRGAAVGTLATGSSILAPMHALLPRQTRPLTPPRRAFSVAGSSLHYLSTTFTSSGPTQSPICYFCSFAGLVALQINNFFLLFSCSLYNQFHSF